MAYSDQKMSGSKVVAIVLIDVFLVMFGNTYWAFAADGGGAAPFMLGGNITESQQFGDAGTGLFFMRVQVEAAASRETKLPWTMLMR